MTNTQTTDRTAVLALDWDACKGFLNLAELGPFPISQHNRQEILDVERGWSVARVSSWT